MNGFSYSERLAAAEQIPARGQQGVMATLSVFGPVDLKNNTPAPEEIPQTLKALVLNMEHGCRPAEIIAFLQECPEMKNADIIFANELDDGTERSGNRDNAANVTTRRKPMGETYLPLQLDWLFGKKLACTAHGVASTCTEDFRWAEKGSQLRSCEAQQISDHNALWCCVAWDRGEA